MILPYRPGLAGEITFGHLAPSPALGHEIPFTVYRPGPAPPTGEHWPVLYLLHGLGDTERTWAELGRVQDTLDRLLATGRIKPLLVVMPMAGRSWYVDDPDPGGAGMMAQALTGDLVAFIEQTYPAARCREGRALGGLSMGGYGALLYAFDHPDRYVAAFSLSGGLFRPMPEEADARAARPTRMFNRAFGQPFDWQRFNAWNLFPRLPAYLADSKRPALYLAIGSDDFAGLKAVNLAFRDALRASGIDVPFRIDPGGHNWSLWAAQLEDALIWLNPFLSGQC
jgi:enterochelin esterase family protein